MCACARVRVCGCARVCEWVGEQFGQCVVFVSVCKTMRVWANVRRSVSLCESMCACINRREYVQ